MKKIILTGGGTAGHVTPNLALIPSLKEHGYEIRYIGSYQGIERKLIEGAGDCLRSVFSPENPFHPDQLQAASGRNKFHQHP